MAEAIFKHGMPLMVDYTPGSAVAAGDVVEVGDVPLVAHNAIGASKLGALAAGGGVYEMVADGTIAAGKKVYWDDSAGKLTVTADSGANKAFGFLLPNSSASQDGDKVLAVHCPDGASI